MRPFTPPADLQARFAAQEGAGQVATPFAVQALQWWLLRRQPERILEIGAGLGTLSAVLCEYLALVPEACADSVEDDPYCAARWLDTFADRAPRPRLLSAAPLGLYDLVILDGPQAPDRLWGAVAPLGSVFVEGGRRAQRAVIRARFQADGRPFVEMPIRPPDRSKGVWIILCEPTGLERLLFWGNRVEQWVRDLPARWRGVAIGKRRR